MLTLTIPEQEFYDPIKEKFFQEKEVSLVMEHSLVSLSKWEAIWKKPFLTKGNKTKEETIDYLRQMVITQNVSDYVFSRLTQENIDRVTSYIEDSMSATTFKEEKGSSSHEIITSELIYYWMIAFQIPFECQKWHLNRLLNLIKICNIKNKPAKKRSTRDVLRENKALNDARRAKLNTKG